jgi:hypothetical protein
VPDGNFTMAGADAVSEVRLAPTMQITEDANTNTYAAMEITLAGVTGVSAGGATRAACLRLVAADIANLEDTYSLWSDAGVVRIDDSVALGGGAAPTVGTIGGAGPGAAAQVAWLRINIEGVDSFVPYWQ